MNAAAMARKFAVDGHLVSVEPLGSGNINDTFLAVFRTVFDEHRFVLQRINSNVFADPAAIMHNMCLVTSHVHRRLEEEFETADRIWQLPRVIPSIDGEDFVIDRDGNIWRAISLIASAEAYDKVQSLEHAREVGVVLGQFQRLINDIPVESLKTTLPGYHYMPSYLTSLDTALAKPEGRERADCSVEAEQCLRFIQQRRDWAMVLEKAKTAGDLKICPIHADPKISNIMIDDDTGKGTCIIDLDTVMPGLIHFDLGDCMRSTCNPVGEETKDLKTVKFDIDLCAAIYDGYFVQARHFISDRDVAYFYDAVRVMTFELAVRFFADYVAGDVYFKTSYPAQNLNRALVQQKLCESIEVRERQIRSIFENINLNAS